MAWENLTEDLADVFGEFGVDVDAAVERYCSAIHEKRKANARDRYKRRLRQSHRQQKRARLTHEDIIQRQKGRYEAHKIRVATDYRYDDQYREKVHKWYVQKKQRTALAQVNARIATAKRPQTNLTKPMVFWLRQMSVAPVTKSGAIERCGKLSIVTLNALYWRGLCRFASDVYTLTSAGAELLSNIASTY